MVTSTKILRFAAVRNGQGLGRQY